MTQRGLQEQLINAHQKLQAQVEVNSELYNEVEQLRKESARLRMALEGQVFNDATRGLCVHEEEEEDGVLLSVTAVRQAKNGPPSAPISIPDRGNTTSSVTDCGFIEASISPSFEIVQTYFGTVNLGQSPQIQSQRVSGQNKAHFSTSGNSSSTCAAAAASPPAPTSIPAQILEEYIVQ